MIALAVNITSVNHHTYATAISTQNHKLQVFLFSYFVFLDYNMSRQLGPILDLRNPLLLKDSLANIRITVEPYVSDFQFFHS